MSTLRKLGVLSVAESFLLQRAAPQLSPIESTIGLSVALYALQAFLWITWAVFVYPKFFSPLGKFPGPKDGHWLMGQMFTMLALPSGDPARKWASEIPNDGLITYKHMFNRERVLLTSPEAYSEVLTKKSYTFTKPPQMRRDLGQILGVGILFAEGDEHKRQRRLLNPAFSFRHVKELYPVFWGKGKEVVLKMDEALRGKVEKGEENADVLDVSEWASRVTLDIIGVAGMGYDFNAVQSPDSELNRCYRSLFSFGPPRWWLFVLAVILPFSVLRRLPLKRNRDVMNARTVIRKVAAEVIAAKKTALKNGEQVKDNDILGVALQSGGFSDDDLVNQLMTFLAAGHETTASSMQWATYLLCKHKDVQEKLRAEIREKLPSIRDNDPNRITAEQFDIARLPYLNAVINEVLRYFPPVPMTMRVAEQDDTILGQHIPKGTTVVVAPWAINHSAAQWGPDACEFRPERWLAPGQANSGGAESNFSNMTFLHGPRSCIGMGFAKAEFACLLASWVGGWQMELKDEENFKLDIGGGITARPRGGLEVRLTSVPGW